MANVVVATSVIRAGSFEADADFTVVDEELTTTTVERLDLDGVFATSGGFFSVVPFTASTTSDAERVTGRVGT